MDSNYETNVQRAIRPSDPQPEPGYSYWADGKGWESPVVRDLGINGLPTVWLLDGKGRLRSLNALEGAAGKARQLFTDR